MHLITKQKEIKTMKKIQKVNRTSAQSVFSFYCPCSGSCSSNCECPVGGSASNFINSLNENNPHATTLV
jgi:putative bacteriocin precursor